MSWLRFGCLLLLISAFGSAQTPSTVNCAALSKGIEQRVEDYLAQRLVSGSGVRPSVKSILPLADTCYRKVTMTIPGTKGDVAMYLSPDERFLTTTLYDMSVDPEKEVARIASIVSKLLMRDNSPRLTGSRSLVAIVEFVDFQCPYCKRFSDWYWNLPESLRNQTTLIFKNLPLPQHPWARGAATYAVCANFQSTTALHQLTRFFFQNQSEITPQNLKDKASNELKQLTGFDLQQLEQCVAGKEAFEVVERDNAIARQLNINNTPTLFINGRRVLRVASAEELQHLLETELANIDSTRPQIGESSAAR